MHNHALTKIGRGSALISALFIMTLVAIAATAISTRLQLDIYRTQLTITRDKLVLASEAVAFWALDTLSDAKPHFKTKVGGDLLLDFPLTMRNIYPDVTTTGELHDLQAFFKS